MNYLDSLYWIHERTKFGIKPGVKRMEWMLNHLNNPQLNIRGIHGWNKWWFYSSLFKSCIS